MNENCPGCGVRLEPEPGFYQGAMYVSYGLSVGVLIAMSILLYFLGNPSQWLFIGAIIAVIILVAPVNFRFSRILYLYWFGGLRSRRR